MNKMIENMKWNFNLFTSVWIMSFSLFVALLTILLGSLYVTDFFHLTVINVKGERTLTPDQIICIMLMAVAIMLWVTSSFMAFIQESFTLISKIIKNN